MKCMLRNILIFFLLSPAISLAQTGISTWASIGSNGKLQYTADSRGNRIPDFSMVGYRHGEAALPVVPVVKTISPVSGDNLAHIQAAINEVAARTPDANGYRGTLLLESGTYNISNTLNISASGVVLRGTGTSSTQTKLVATRTAQHTLINVKGSGGPSEVSGTRVSITNTYVPTGATSFTVSSAAGYAVGDRIRVLKMPNQAWIDLLGMAPFGWTPSGYNMSYLRVIKAIAGNTVTIDAPIVDPIDQQYGSGYIYKYNWTGKIQESGVEDMRIESTYAAEDDENHGWTAINLGNIENGWVKNVDAYYFGYSCVSVTGGAYKVTILDCKMLDPKSQTTGGRKYSFMIDGSELVLFKDCFTRGGRHDYVSGSTVSGPNVFYNCTSEQQKADNGPHHRWSTGILFDNITGNGELNIQNREASGSGHGWAGAQCVFWNCVGSKFVHQKPPQHLNWAIGCKGNVTDNGTWHDGDPGIWESTGNHVIPQSLYAQQLADRLGAPSCVPATASADDGNVAANVLDNNLSTRWSASGDGQWIQFCLANSASVTGVDIAFYSGNTRTSTFDVLIGADGNNWTNAATGLVSSGTSLNLETFNFSAVTGKYVRIVGHGNSANLWNSYTEVKIRIATGSTQVTLSPIHDAYVRNGTNATVTHGITDSTTLLTKLNSNPAAGNDRQAYLKFDLSSVSGTVTAAKLRVYGSLADNRSANIPIGLYKVSNLTWLESTLTWNNKPATGSPLLDSAIVTDSIPRYYDWDFGAYVQAELAAGRTSISLAMLAHIATAPVIAWNSSEAATNKPELVLTVQTTGTARKAQQEAVVLKPEKPVPGLLTFPNPFYEELQVKFELKEEGRTVLRVYDLSGKVVATLIDARLAAGNHSVRFNGKAWPKGLYMLHLQHNGKKITAKVAKQ